MSPPAIGDDLARIVVVLPSWVGDTVMATPVLRALRAARPRARLIGVMRPGLDYLLAGSPWLDAMIAATMRGGLAPLRLGRRIRDENPDAVLLLPNSFRSALVAWLSRAPRRIGYARDARRHLLTHPVPVLATERPTPTVQYYTHLAREALGLETMDETLELMTTDEQEAAADAALDGVAGPFAVLNPGGNKEPKRWPPERFAAVADHLAHAHGLAVAVTGSPGEADLVARVCTLVEHDPINLCRRGITLGSLKAVLRRAALLVTNDTGPRHIAAALGTPVVALFGPTDHRWTTIDFPAERIVLADPFLPEEKVADRYPRQCAIEKIAVGDVIAATDSLLAETMAQEAAS